MRTLTNDRADICQPIDRLAYTSIADFAAMLGRSHEFARQLIRGSGQATFIPKGPKGFWLISRTWAKKFVRLHETFRQAENRQRPPRDDYEERGFVDLSIVHAGGTREAFSLASASCQPPRRE